MNENPANNQERIAPSPETSRRELWFNRAFYSFLIGAVLFSGGRYTLSLRAVREKIHAVFPESELEIPEDTEANKILKEFPRELPQAWRIENDDIIVTPGARHLLVHIRQIHKHPMRDDTPEELKELAVVQNQIFEILKKLVDDHGLKNLYAEGVTKEISAYLMNMLGDLNHESRKLDMLGGQMSKTVLEAEISSLEGDISYIEQELNASPPNILWSEEDKKAWELKRTPQWKEEQKAALEQAKKDLKKKKEALRAFSLPSSEPDFDFTQVDAIEAIRAIRQLVQVKRAEDPHAHQAASDVIHSNNFDTKIVVEDREDALLPIIAQKGDVYAGTVYGAAHDWRDAIERWNADPANADRKFSFVQVTPLYFSR